MRTLSLNTFLLVLVAGSVASGCSIITNLDGWAFGEEDAGRTDTGRMDAGPMDAGPDCASGLTECSGECVNLDSSAGHCGACGSACPTPPNTISLCSAASCDWECAGGFGDCNGDPGDGCEAELTSDPLNCGTCTMACESRFFCQEGGCLPMLPWVRAFGNTDATGRAEMKGIAIDPEGNIYITGSFLGILSFGGATLESHKNADGVHTRDVFVGSFTASGEHRWSRSGGGAADAFGTAIALDGSGSAPKVHVTGYFSERVRFDQHPSRTDPASGGPLVSDGSDDIFIASFDAADGSHLGSRGWGGSEGDRALGIAVDPSGNIYVTGNFAGSYSNFGGRILSSAGSSDIFVASYSPGYAITSNARWAERFGSVGWEAGQAIRVDSSGKVYVTGAFEGQVSFGESTLTSAGGLDVFVARLNSSGAHDWSIRGGAAAHDVGRGIALDAEGNIYISGSFMGTASFGGDPQESSGSFDMFLASYDASGGHRWSERAGGPSDDQGFAIAGSPNGEVYSTGHFDQTADFADVTLASGGQAAFVATNGAADGVHLGAFAIGGPDGTAQGYSIAAGAGLVCVAANFTGSIAVGEETLIATGAVDGFVACFEP